LTNPYNLGTGTNGLITFKDKTDQLAAAEDNSWKLHDYTHEEIDEYLFKELQLPRR
jgi:hypothetical protein